MSLISPGSGFCFAYINRSLVSPLLFPLSHLLISPQHRPPLTMRGLLASTASRVTNFTPLRGTAPIASFIHNSSFPRLLLHSDVSSGGTLLSLWSDSLVLVNASRKVLSTLRVNSVFAIIRLRNSGSFNPITAKCRQNRCLVVVNISLASAFSQEPNSQFLLNLQHGPDSPCILPQPLV